LEGGNVPAGEPWPEREKITGTLITCVLVGLDRHLGWLSSLRKADNKEITNLQLMDESELGAEADSVCFQGTIGKKFCRPRVYAEELDHFGTIRRVVRAKFGQVPPWLEDIGTALQVGHPQACPNSRSSQKYYVIPTDTAPSR
jgi:hypothetical protein